MTRKNKIQRLRVRTAAGKLDCIDALEACNWNLERAYEMLKPMMYKGKLYEKSIQD